MYESRKKQLSKSLMWTVVGVTALGGAKVWSAATDVFKKDNFQCTAADGSPTTCTAWGKELRFTTNPTPTATPGPYDSGRVDVAPGDISGHKSFRFEWDPDHVVPNNNPSRHAELKTTSPFSWASPYNSSVTPKLDQWLGFRIYIDSAKLGPNNSSDVILMQYHDKPDPDATVNGNPCTEAARNPIAALTYSYGQFKYGWKGDKEHPTKRDISTNNALDRCGVASEGPYIYTQKGSVVLGSAKMDSWNTFVFHHKFDPFGKGSYEIWCNDEPLKTQSNIHLGYNDQQAPYLKYGFYWASITQPFSGPSRAIWFDDVKIGNGNATYADVMPPGAPTTPKTAASTSVSLASALPTLREKQS